MRGHFLRVFERAAVGEIGGDPGRAEGVAADRLGDPGGDGAPADHPPGVGLGHRVLGQHLAVVTPCGPEQPALAVFGDARRGDIGVQSFGESVMARHRVLNAACAFTGAGPGALRARSPAVPSRPKIQRQCRTLSACTQNAAAIRSLVHRSNDSSMVRARSASSRSAEPAKARNSSRCAAVAEIHDWLGMFPYMR